MSRIRVQDIKPLRELKLQEQQGLCALCGEPLKIEEAVLDHCHRSGFIRGVIHNKCNTLLGKIESFVHRYKHPNVESFLRGCYLYMETTTDIIHPTHRTDEERKLLRNKRARRARKSKKRVYAGMEKEESS